MKKYHFGTRILALGLAVGLMVPSAGAAASFTSTSIGFYQELSQLVKSRDRDYYFGTMELTIGSNILTLDGVDQQMDTAPDVVNSRTMLPIRFIAESAGAEVSYQAETQTVVIQTPYGDTIRVPIGGSSMTMNAEVQSLDVPAYAKNNRTYLPVRAISEALDFEVEWDQATSTVRLTAPYQTARLLVWSKNLDAGSLGAEEVLYDGADLWVLQFTTPAEAKAAHERLEAAGVTVSPDYFIPPVQDLAASTGVSAKDENHSWGVEDCKFDEFVAEHDFTGEGVVAVVDTGVDASHPFLQGRVKAGYDFVDGDSNAADEHYHGTHVSGTVIDCVGDAPVSILPVRVLDEQGRGATSIVVSGVKFAAQNGADVINLSLGGSRGTGDVLDAAIEDAIYKGTIVVAAAGNDSSDTSYFCPSHITTPGMVVVSAGDQNHQKAYFTNHGKSVDLMAPGMKIEASTPNGSYKTLQGTSMASPHVAAAAILLDLATGKTLTPAQLESKVRSATTNNGSWQDEYKGCGFLDMSKAELPGGGTPTPNPTVVGYRYSAQSFSMEVGDRETVKVYAKFSDGTEKDVTASSKLYSTNPSVADVSTDGTVTAKAAGKAQLTMAAAPDAVGIPAPVQVTVSDSVERPTPDDPDQNDAIVRYEWECVQQLVLHVGDEMDIRLFAVHSSGKRDDVTSKARLYTLDESIARVENGSPAVLTALAVGDTKMAFEFAGVAGGVEIPAPIAVHVKAEIPAPAPEPDPDTFVRLYWSFSNAGDTASGITLSRGRSLQVDIMGETTDGRTVKLTQECQPYTSDTGVATISETGRLTAVGSGTTTLWLRSIPNVNLELPPLLEISVP